MNPLAVMVRLRRRPVQLALSVLVSLTMGALLVVTIYWTRFDPRWNIFLGGVLFAAVLATASSASKAEWIVVRRTRQIERLRAKLAEAAARSATATEAFRTMEARARGLADALTQPVFLCDREEICRFHNTAAAHQAQAPDLVGKPLREIFGEAVYTAMQPHIHGTFAGVPARYELRWQAGASEATYLVRQLPHPMAANPEGIWLVLEPRPADATPAGDERSVGEAAFLSAIARELTGWDDPRGKLTRALAEDKFLFYEQRVAPLDLAAPDAACGEILLRLQEEEDNLLPPGGFLPEAERLGLMAEIDRWVVRHLVSRTLQRLEREPQWRVPLYFVNLSLSAVRDPGLGRYVQRQIQRGFPGRSLGFEIGEADIVAQPAEVRRLIAMLKPFGCRFSCDAFGSVKGSFAPLKDLALDFLKIDGVIVQNIRRDPAQLARLRAIAAACRRIGVRTIAEFVEDDETLGLLRRAGVDYAQGFGVARPVPFGADAPAAVARAA